jgi:hypothetical protein
MNTCVVEASVVRVLPATPSAVLSKFDARGSTSLLLRFASAQKHCGGGGGGTGAVDRTAAAVVGSLTNCGSIVTF